MERRPLWILIMGILFLAVITYSMVLEPNNLKVNRFDLYFEDLPPEMDGLTIAHVSDLHLHRVGHRENEVLSILQEESPDLIAITGDMVDRAEDKEQCMEYLGNFQAGIGIWAVQGNWEHHVGWVRSSLRRDLADEGIDLLVDEGEFIPGSEGQIWICGTDDPSLGKDNIGRSLEGCGDSFVILLGHSPDVMNRAPGKVRLILAGHTHGGQVRIPFIGAPWAKRMGGGFLSGIYESNETVMYVSKGVGMTTLPIRFLCRPDIALIRLKKKTS